MQIYPRIFTAPNGQWYAAFFSAGYAYKWARAHSGMGDKIAIRIGNLTGFLI